MKKQYNKKTEKCIWCGESDKTLFYSNNKSRCKKCVGKKGAINQKNIYNNNGIHIDLNNWKRYFEDGAQERIREWIINDIIPDLDKIYKKKKLDEYTTNNN